MSRRLIKGIALAVVVLVFAPIAAIHVVLRASLPRIDGRIESDGVRERVTIERDALGTPTITAGNRADLAFATGFVHGQDRFFQMDLSRRLSAGELSELFGAAALEQDRKARVFRFRHVARQVLAQATQEQRELLEAYARGVNAGVSSLQSRPWEYWLLSLEPSPWKAEDTVLVSHAMWWDLQYADFGRERVRLALNAKLGGPDCGDGWKCALRFLYPARTRWDAPIVADEKALRAPGPTESASAKAPSEQEFDVRGRGAQHTAASLPTAARRSAISGVDPPGHAGRPDRSPDLRPERIPTAGSNNWAVAGRLTTNGAALVASDMHLGLRVPIVWYRARLRVVSDDEAQVLDLNGLTLPGAPVLVAGSNGHIAWSFTNSYGDWSDLHPAPCAENALLPTAAAVLPAGSGTVPSRTVTDNAQPLTVVREIIRVKGGADVEFPVTSSPLGVLVARDPQAQRCWFASWLAQVPEATNLNVFALERVQSVEEALAVVPTIGIPHQNFVVGDREGHIGWTVVGRIPDSATADRTTGRVPWRPASAYPRLIDPPLGRIWTANARPTDDPAAESAIGGDEGVLGASYDLGARAGQIRDGLLALNGGATPEQMLNIQLDDRAVFLAHWRKLLLGLLDAPALDRHPARAEFKRLVAGWEPRATTGSVGYRLVRDFRNRTESAVWLMILQALGVDEPDAPVPAQFEEPLWTLVTEQPLHMLDAQYPSWREFLLEQVDRTVAELEASCGALERCTWGSHKPVRVRHPLSRALPLLSRFLDMPEVLLPGDHDMPRVQDGAFGASERFAVAPGHEDEGYLHLPGGASGHPLSPYYRAGFREWAEGRPLPFLPGSPQHTLVLAPQGR